MRAQKYLEVTHIVKLIVAIVQINPIMWIANQGIIMKAIAIRNCKVKAAQLDTISSSKYDRDSTTKEDDFSLFVLVSKL